MPFLVEFPFLPRKFRLVHNRSLFPFSCAQEGMLVFLGIQGWQQGVLLKPLTGWIWLLWEQSLGERLTSCWVRTSRNCYNGWQVPKLKRICEYLHINLPLTGTWSTLIPRVQGGSGDDEQESWQDLTVCPRMRNPEAIAPTLTIPQR